MTTVKRYEDCATRLELRGFDPPTQGFVDALVAGLQKTGIEACWHSAVDGECRPLFPSQVFPNWHKQASLESFHYLIERLHAIGRPVVSWYAMIFSIGLTEAHPDWRVAPMLDESVPVPHRQPPLKQWCCLNTPYGELLPRFAVELVREVGFDGIWFDGATLAVESATNPGCLCDHCRRRFARDTGLELPVRADYSSRAFRLWLNWRYDCLMELWQRILAAVHAVKPEATICFNNSRHRYENYPRWTTGIPLRKLGLDAVMAGELSLQVLQADFQIKMHRAYGCKRGAETWMPFCDHWNMWTPDVESLPLEQGAVAAISAGGVASMGVGVPPRLIERPLAAVARAAAALMPYRDGETVRYAAIWASQQAQDFHDQLGRQVSWDAWHGANELCLHSHLQSSIVFDDHVRDGDIMRYPVLLAGNAACLDQQQADAVRRYVENGGVLLACHEFGKNDALGYPHPKPPLDDFLGIETRAAPEGNATLEVIDAELAKVCGDFVSYRAPHCRATAAAGVRLLGNLVERQRGGDWEKTQDPSAAPFPRHPGLWMVKRGKGTVVYACVDIFSAYLAGPTLHMQRLFKALLTRLAEPALALDGPICVAMNTRRIDQETWLVHLHNAPGAVYRYPGVQVFNSGELLPICDLRLKLNAVRAARASSGLSGKALPVADGGQTIHIPRLERNEVVLIKVDFSS